VAPDGDGGSEITHYVIHYGTADMDFESFEKHEITGDKTSCTISRRIRRNKEYKFAVAAENKSGVGPLSEFSEWIKIADLWGKRVQYLSLSAIPVQLFYMLSALLPAPHTVIWVFGYGDG